MYKLIIALKTNYKSHIKLYINHTTCTYLLDIFHYYFKIRETSITEKHVHYERNIILCIQYTYKLRVLIVLYYNNSNSCFYVKNI